MPTLLIASPEAGSGKSMVAAGLARRLRSQADLRVEESPAGDLPAQPGAQVIVVVTPETEPAAAAAYAKGAAGVIVNRAPAKKLDKVRAEYEAAGVRVLGVVPEDRLLASPTIAQVADALQAEGEFIDENRERPLDRPIIASIAADPGQTYFDRTQANAVIVRGDKPDLQLAALNAGASCLIVTGGLPVLSYVTQRVAEDEVPLLRTTLDTKQTIDAIEELFGSGPFSAGELKTRRAEELLAGVDVDALFAKSAGKA